MRQPGIEFMSTRYSKVSIINESATQIFTPSNSIFVKQINDYNPQIYMTTLKVIN